MAAINFPSSPTLNQTFTANDRTFIWDGTSWIASTTISAGADGYTGSIGYTGSAGADGTIGVDGYTGSIGYTGSQGVWADLDSVSANLIPAADVTYDLGNVSYRWRDLYLSGNTINLGNATISSSNTAVVLPADSKIGNVAIASQEFVSSTVTSSVPTFVANSSAPTNPTLGDFWFSTTKNALYQYANLGYNQYWLAITGNPVTFGVSNATTSSISESSLYPTYVEYLIAAGGGGAGPWATGGGGGGGFLEGTTSIGAGTYAVTVGAGGATATNQYSGGQSGTNSAFVLDVVNLTAIGGGGGASYSTGNPAKSGGSGGGGSGRHPAGGLGTSGQGYAGGIGMMWNQGSGSGGGGGAAGVGGNATATTYGLGGPGLSRDITGSAITYSSGGQGNRYENYENAKNGAPNTGQGAGAAGGGGTGGSGVVVLRYPDSYPEPYATTGSPTVTVANGYRTYVFTASGTISFFVTG